MQGPDLPRICILDITKVSMLPELWPSAPGPSQFFERWKYMFYSQVVRGTRAAMAQRIS
jgi:hypothetical protein